jgi:acetylornithine deacetylase
VDDSVTVKLLKELIRINSVNPSLVPGAPGESEIAEHIAEFMKAIGLETSVEEVQPGRPNAVGILKGCGGGSTLMLNGHTDTVGVDYMEIDPLDPKAKDGLIYGRGAYDMKGGLAAILSAAKAVVDSGSELKGDLIVAAVCDEEFVSIGTEALVRHVKADAAIVGEPTKLQVLVAHKGFAWIDVETRGVAAHGSSWQVGVDAIAKMGKVQVGLEQLLNEALMKRKHTLVGLPSVHASTIKGGRELSTYPDYCRLQVERRLIPGETVEDVHREMKGLLDSIYEADRKFDGGYNITFYRSPFEIPLEEEVCRILTQSSLEATGEKPSFIGGSGWLDTQIIWEHGTPAVAFGPAGAGAHASIECVEVDSVIKNARILEVAISRFCSSREANLS